MAADAVAGRASKRRGGAIRRIAARHWVTVVSRLILGVLLLLLWQLLAHLEPLFVAKPDLAALEQAIGRLREPSPGGERRRSTRTPAGPPTSGVSDNSASRYIGVSPNQTRTRC